LLEERVDAADRVAWVEWERAWREDFRTLSSHDWLTLMFAHLGVTLPQSDLDALAHYFNIAILHVDPPLSLIEGAGDAVQRLARRYPLGIISDTGLSDGRTLRRFLERDGLLERFACLTFSDEVGRCKPHPDVFRRTLDCLGARPGEAVHIGDLTRTDIAGAKGVGMRAVRMTAANDDPDASVRPDATIDSFADFERLIQMWDGEA